MSHTNNIQIIKTLYEERGIIIDTKSIKECVRKTSKKHEDTQSNVENAIIHNFQNHNFIGVTPFVYYSTPDTLLYTSDFWDIMNNKYSILNKYVKNNHDNLFRVLSFDMNGLSEYESFFNMIDNLTPNVICLQNTFIDDKTKIGSSNQSFKQAFDYRGYVNKIVCNSYNNKTNYTGPKNIIFSKNKIIDGSDDVLYLKNKDGWDKCVNIATIILSQTQHITIINVNLDWLYETFESRKEALRQIIDYATTKNCVVLCGNFGIINVGAYSKKEIKWLDKNNIFREKIKSTTDISTKYLEPIHTSTEHNDIILDNILFDKNSKFINAFKELKFSNKYAYSNNFIFYSCPQDSNKSSQYSNNFHIKNITCVSSNVYYTNMSNNLPLISDFRISVNNSINEISKNIPQENNKTPKNISQKKPERLDDDFILSSYNINVDDQIENTYNDTRYENWNYSHELVRKWFPIYDDKTILPQIFSKRGYWIVQKEILSKLKENVNWTKKTLSYTRDPTVAKHISRCIIQPLIKKGLFGISLEDYNDKINIVDVTGNLGMDSITLAMEPYTNSIKTYEMNDSTFNLLKNNVELYGFSNKINLHNNKFDYDIPKNSLVIIDPPYETISNNVSNENILHKRFSLSIDNMPIYVVCEKLLERGAKCVIITMPSKFKYNMLYATENNQHVEVYLTEKKNIKVYTIMRTEDGERLHLTNFSHNIVSSDVSLNFKDKFPCHLERNVIDESQFKPRYSESIKWDNSMEKIARKVTGEKDKNVRLDDMLHNFYCKNVGKSRWLSTGCKDKKDSYFDMINRYFNRGANKMAESYMDFGCGGGVDLRKISDIIRPKEIIAADIKDERINEYIDKNDIFLLVKKDYPMVELKDNSIDLITMFHVIHHLINADVRLKDIHRVLRIGGILLIKDHDVTSRSVANIVNFEHFVYSIGEGTAKITDKNDYPNIEPMFFYSKSQVQYFLENLGMKKIDELQLPGVTKSYYMMFVKEK